MALEITRRDARRQALAGLIDYAGLFPPSSLDMGSAAAEYRAARLGPEAWLVDRFICPADRLVELARVLITTMRSGEPPWSLVVTAAPGDATVVADFSSELGRSARIDAVEVRLPAGATASEVGEILKAFDRIVYFEVPWRDPVAARLQLLAEVRQKTGRSLGAKIRCGGTTPDAFPPAAAVAAFLAECARLRLPVKATAGLHHPLRHTDPTTGFTHHGFLNLLAAAALANSGESTAELEAVLEETHAAEFSLDSSGLGWRHHRVGGEALAALRRELLVGYGSCSIAEPAADLIALGILPVRP